jgi:hypothetical protein
MPATRVPLLCLLILAAGILGIASSAVDVQAFMEKLYGLMKMVDIEHLREIEKILSPEAVKALQDEAFDAIDEKKV